MMDFSTVCFRSRQAQQQMHSLGLMGLAHKVSGVRHDGPGL